MDCTIHINNDKSWCKTTGNCDFEASIPRYAKKEEKYIILQDDSSKTFFH